MKVTRIAFTTIDQYAIALETDYQWNYEDDLGVNEPDELAEMSGRICYKSFDRPNPATAKNVDYLANILKQQHYSVLEHASVTFLVEGVSRSLLTELERHRHLSFSVVSQRYVDESDGEFVTPPALKEYPDLAVFASDAHEMALQGYQMLYEGLLSKGLKKKQAREAARSVLLNGHATSFVVTGNLRTWREILGKRLSDGADAEIRRLAEEILRQLKDYAPNTFQDM